MDTFQHKKAFNLENGEIYFLTNNKKISNATNFTKKSIAAFSFFF
jgi:hypothetical protein